LERCKSRLLIWFHWQNFSRTIFTETWYWGNVNYTQGFCKVWASFPWQFSMGITLFEI